MLLRNNKHKGWIEISQRALLSNLHTFQKIVGKNTKIAPVIKANAYGHGLVETFSILKNKNIEVFAVDNITEALLLRKLDNKIKILVLGYTTLVNLESAIKNNISFVAYNEETIKKIISLSLSDTARIHLKVETGLNRQGLSKSEVARFLRLIKKYKKKIALEGVYTHFANIEDTLDPAFAMEQLKRFNEVLKLVKKEGFNPEFIHSTASAGALLYKETHFSLIRPGLALYGLWPSSETKVALLLKKKNINLQPVLTWKSIVAQVKVIQKDESVGYGRTWFSSRKTVVAIIPVGYSDGFDRKLSNVGRVIVKDSYARVIGRVAMNMIMVDVTDIKGVKVEDEVILIGKKGKLNISPEELANKIGTINYEVIARINPQIPRIVI